MSTTTDIPKENITDETITRDAPARPPLSLSNSQLTAVLDAAQPLPPDLRSPFLAAVAHALRGVPVGDGSVHRINREVQREFWHPPIAVAGRVG